VSGSPTDDEARAIDSAVAALWRQDEARRSGGGPSPWVLAARAAATRRGPAALRRGWRWSSRLAPPESHIKAGRGDAR
jgi:hypothetical protein